MKKLALALAFGALTIGAVSAQTSQATKVKADRKEVKIKKEVKGEKDQKYEAKTPEERAEREAKKLTTDLGLNAGQSSQIRELSLRKAQQMAALKQRAGENKDANHEEMKQIRTNYQNDLKNILTPDQFQKFEAMKAERKDKMKAKHGDHENNGKHKGEYKNKK